MSKNDFFFILLFIISLQLQSIVKCEEDPEVINIDDSKSLTLTEKTSYNAYFALEYTKKELSNYNNIIISTKSSSFDNPAFIYASFSAKNPSADDRTFYSQSLGINELILNTTKLNDSTKLYINIHSLKECNVNFEVKGKIKISLSLENKKSKFKLSDLTQLNFTPDEDISSKKIMFYTIGESANYFSMKVEYSYNNAIIKEYNSEQKFENGYGIIIDLKEIKNPHYGSFIITITPNETFPGIFANEKIVEVGLDLTEEGKNSILEVNVLEHIYGYITTGENCYKLKNLDDTKNITILLNSFTQAMTFGLYDNEKGEKQYSLDVFNNYYLKLPSYYFSENYFCFKKFTPKAPKEKEKEELGEISYDFQIYYDDDLSEIQTFIDPLVNGRIYTHSLKRGEIMIYRHSSFTNYNFLYTAIMNVIWGKPVLYGYTCKTFPECNLDEEKLENLKKNTEDIDEIKNFNQYFINKKYYAPGDQDKYGEKMSEAREQYLTVIKCESTDDLPNSGECKYTIEIDNYLDEIQLIPEIVFTNSLQFYKNYYKIKVADYQNIEYLNIYFTILTGNADINVYSDKEHKSLISNYNYRHVHRKEIIEIKENFVENYYILINSNDSAFVEIKYETDFYNRGYNKMNPNEVNIEFVNKENNMIPYEINNPDYLYPTDNPKNNDFYFTVKSLDCSMIYNYNFIDFFNLTSIHHEVKTDDISYATCYAFMLKVDNYFHTNENNKEDCAMIIYTGEESQNTPLLIMEDIPNPSNFTNTYYICPFSPSSSFDGIIVDIKIDTELLTKMDVPPNVVVTFKVANQKENFETYNINGDYTFYIKKKSISKYCTSNYYQCSLTIELNKIYEENEEIPYIIITNVHTSMSSVEYIFKNTVYNRKLFPQSSRYFYTQIDKDEEGEVNFNFNSGNAQIFANLVEKNKIEEHYNWNRRVQLPDDFSKDLLKYDPLNNVIKYSAKDYNNCEKGCELYIHIKSQEKAEKDSSFTEVSFSFDQKRNDIKENSVVEMNMDSYVKGTFEKNKYKYYTVTIPQDYYKISINLYSQYGKAYIKLGKGHICKKDDSVWEINPVNNFGRVIIYSTDEKIDKNSLKGVTFSIGITNVDNLPDVEINENLYYYLEIQGLYNNNKDYYHLNSDRSIICNTGNDNYCHILLNLNHYYNVNYNLIYASLLFDNNRDNMNIYTKFYTMNDFKSKTYKDSIQNLFPTDSDYSQNSNGKNYLLLNQDLLSEEIDNVILLTVDCGKNNSFIKLVVSGPDVSKTLLPYNTEKIIYLYKDMKFFLPYDYNGNVENNNEMDYLINVKTLNGNGELVVNNGDTYSNLQGNYFIEMKHDSTEKAFEINYSEDTLLIISYDIIKKNNLVKLDKNIKNEVSYLFNEKNSLPQYAYIELISPLKIEIVFLDIQYNDTKFDDIFTIEAYIINEDTLIKRKLNPEEKITGDKINGYYLQYEKTGIVRIESDKIKTDDKYYIYLVINKDINNKNKYKSMKIEYSVNDMNSESAMEIYPNKFFFSSLNSSDSEDQYLIKKKSEHDNYLIIDIAENIPANDSLSIKKILYQENKFRNLLEEVKIEEYDYFGRKRVKVDLSGDTYDSIELRIKKKYDNDNACKNYSINYYSVENIQSFDNYSLFNDTVTIKTNPNNTKKSTLVFTSFTSFKRPFDISDVTYYLDIFEKNDEILDYKEIYSIYMGNHDEKIYKSYTYKSSTMFEREVSISVDVSKDDMKSKYIVRLLADVYNIDGSRDKFIYNSTLVNNGDDEPQKEDTDNNLILFILLFVVVVCLIIMVIVVLFLKLHKKHIPPEPDINETKISLPYKEMPQND